MHRLSTLVLALAALGASGAPQAGAPRPHVELRRTPDGGIQPQAVVERGTLHLIYYKGDPRHGDVHYVASKDDGKTFTKPLRVNTRPGSAIAAGNIRGAHLAVSESGRVHVAWMGSHQSEPKASGGGAPMLYARLNDAGDAFEPQRNLITFAEGLDGGGSIAAQGRNVYVLWHAPTPGLKGEEHRRVWLAASADDGATFAKERAVSPADTGVCGCCGLRALVTPDGQPGALYRSASDKFQRDAYFVSASPKNEGRALRLQEWRIGACPMSSFAFTGRGQDALIAWETDGQIWWTRAPSAEAKAGEPAAAPGAGGQRKHPALASNGRATLLAWTEGMGWNRGGKLAWQVYDEQGQPVDAPAGAGRADGVPAWSLITAVPRSDGRFLVVY